MLLLLSEVAVAQCFLDITSSDVATLVLILDIPSDLFQIVFVVYRRSSILFWNY